MHADLIADVVALQLALFSSSMHYKLASMEFQFPLTSNETCTLTIRERRECRFHLSLVEVLAHVDYILAFLTLKIAANFAKMPQAEYLLYLKNEIFCLYFTYFHSTGYHIYILFS